MRSTRILFFAALAILLTACGEGKFHSHQAWTRPTASGGNAAVYFLIHNATNQDDELVAITTDVARVVEMHRSSIMNPDEMGAEEHEGEDHEHTEGEEHVSDARPLSELEALDLADVMIMAPLDHISIAAGHEISLEPGIYHLMLVDMQRDLVVGDQFIIVLHFTNSADLEIEVQVLAP